MGGKKTQDIGQVREKCQKKSEYLAMCKSTNFNMNHFLIVAFTMAATVNFATFHDTDEAKTEDIF